MRLRFLAYLYGVSSVIIQRHYRRQFWRMIRRAAARSASTAVWAKFSSNINSRGAMPGAQHSARTGRPARFHGNYRANAEASSRATPNTASSRRRYGARVYFALSHSHSPAPRRRRCAYIVNHQVIFSLFCGLGCLSMSAPSRRRAVFIKDGWLLRED